MKIKINEEEILNISPHQIKLLLHDISSVLLEEDIKRRLKYVIENKCAECFLRLKKEWEPKLKEAGVESIPLNEEAFAAVVFSQENYKDRTERNKLGQQ